MLFAVRPFGNVPFAIGNVTEVAHVIQVGNQSDEVLAASANSTDSHRMLQSFTASICC